MAVDIAALAADLHAETLELERLLGRVDGAAWDTPTPAPGWRIHDQVTHLAYFDYAATIAAVDPVRFQQELEDARRHPDGITERVRIRYADLSRADVLSWFRRERTAMLSAFSTLDASTRVPWYGTEMSLASSLTARIMETWAHGQDIADAMHLDRRATGALRHVAHLGAHTLPNSFRARGLPVPAEPVYVALRADDREVQRWGPPSARDRVTGEMIDFCLVVTQRRHVDDTALEIEGPVASHWMKIAQAFAGPPGEGRRPSDGS